MVKLVSWNIAHREEAWRHLVDGDADVALLQDVAVVLDIREFEAMRERLALFEDIARAEAQLDAGEGIPHDEAKARILKRIDACR